MSSWAMACLWQSEDLWEYSGRAAGALNPQTLSFAPEHWFFALYTSSLTAEPRPQALCASSTQVSFSSLNSLFAWRDLLFPSPMSLGFKYSFRHHLPWKITWLPITPGLNPRVQATLDSFYHSILDTRL